MNSFSKATSTVCFCWVLILLSPISKASTINYTFFGVTKSNELAGEVFTSPFSYDNLTISNASIESLGLIYNPKNPAFDLYTALKQSNGISQSTTNFFDSLFTGLSYSSDIITGRPSLSRIIDDESSLPSLANKPESSRLIIKKDGGGSNKGGVGGSGGGNPYNTNTTSNLVNFSVAVPSVQVPGAVWLFGSGLAIFVVSNRRKRQTLL